MLRAIIAVAGCACALWATTARAQTITDRIEQLRTNRQIQHDPDWKGRILGVLHQTPVTIRFVDTPAREAIDALASTLGIRIVGRYLDDRTGLGIDPVAPIDLDAVDEPGLSVLETILEQCSDERAPCTWQLRRGALEVSTKERLALHGVQEIRYYPVRAVLLDPPNFEGAPDFDLEGALNQMAGGEGGAGAGGSLFDNPGAEPDRPTEAEQARRLITLITTVIEPDGWARAGGGWGTIRYHDGMLIVRAPDFVHRAIGGYPAPLPMAILRPGRP